MKLDADKKKIFEIFCYMTYFYYSYLFIEFTVTSYKIPNKIMNPASKKLNKKLNI